MPSKSNDRRPNRLVLEKSPYLLQHAYNPVDWYEIAHNHKIPLDELKERLKKAREKLFATRERRVHPSKDDKILIDWNGLMIVALAKASKAFNEVKYADAAKRAVTFIFDNMRDSKGRLYHRYRDGEAAILGFLDDYAFLICGLLELYETTFEARNLQRAISLTEEMMKHFWDENQGGFYFTADDAESILVRNKEIYANAVLFITCFMVLINRWKKWLGGTLFKFLRMSPGLVLGTGTVGFLTP